MDHSTAIMRDYVQRTAHLIGERNETEHGHVKAVIEARVEASIDTIRAYAADNEPRNEE